MDTKLTVTLEVWADRGLTRRELQNWFDQRKLNKIGVIRVDVSKVVENHPWEAQSRFEPDDEEDRD
jgi:uncharacterized protein YjiS (DUF1127 family)